MYAHVSLCGCVSWVWVPMEAGRCPAVKVSVRCLT